MKNIKLLSIIFLITAQHGYAQQKADNRKEITSIINNYSKSVIEKDSVTEGTVASVSMDYSFWADNKITNWGGKYLSLIKRDGKWEITSVIYSLELTDYFEQPTLKERQKGL